MTVDFLNNTKIWKTWMLSRESKFTVRPRHKTRSVHSKGKPVLSICICVANFSTSVLCIGPHPSNRSCKHVFKNGLR